MLISSKPNRSRAYGVDFQQTSFAKSPFSDRRVRIPARFHSILKDMECDRLILAPIDNCLHLIPEQIIKTNSEYANCLIQEILLDSDCNDLIVNNAIFPLKSGCQKISADQKNQLIKLLKNKIKYDHKNHPVLHTCYIDAQGRFYLPKPLFKYLNLSQEKEIVWMGILDRICLEPKTVFDKLCQKLEDELNASKS